MPDEALAWMQRIKAVEREYGVIRFGADRLLAAVTANPRVLLGQMRRKDIVTAAGHLKGAYVVRVFSEFETALQHFLRMFRIRKPSGAEAVINRVRVRGRIPQAETDAAHRVRLYRNVLVHERTEPVTVVSMREATSALCTFLSRVKAVW